jgi:hypothetical protein
MTNGSDRLDRIERILEDTAKRQDQFFANFSANMDEVRGMLRETAARQQYHDEAFERFDTEMKLIKEAQAVDGEHIRALVRIAELHNQRFEHLEGGEAN